MASYMLCNDCDGEETKFFPRRDRVFRDRTSQLDSLCDQELIARYRVPRDAIFRLVELVRDDVEHPTQRSHALSPETQVLLTLRFLSKGGFLLEMGDLHGVSCASVSRSFHRTIDALCKSLPAITFPAPTDQAKLHRDFHSIARFPRVIGAVDGTLIPIKRPSKDEEAAYVCRKGYHAINVQAVCDAKLRFTNVVIKWPGSCHDSFILTNSSLGQAFDSDAGNPDGWLLGDSGYPCRKWILTPILDPKTRGEEKYNTAHMRTRNVVERAFGVLKSRFRCLHKSTGCLQFSPVKCTKIIQAAFLLHNFCVTLRLPEPALLEGEDDTDDVMFDVGDNQGGNHVRTKLINNYFS